MLSFSRRLSAAYENLGMEAHLKFKDRTTGITYSATATSDSNTDLAGIKIAYAKMPKNDFGLNMGFAPLKVNRSNSDNKTYYLLRGEGNVTLATPINNNLAIYGFGGANLAHMTDSPDISPLGMGLQAGAGLSIASQISIEAGNSYTMIRPRSSISSSNSNYTIDEESSYFSMKGLSTRVTYNF